MTSETLEKSNLYSSFPNPEPQASDLHFLFWPTLSRPSITAWWAARRITSCVHLPPHSSIHLPRLTKSNKQQHTARSAKENDDDAVAAKEPIFQTSAPRNPDLAALGGQTHILLMNRSLFTGRPFLPLVTGVSVHISFCAVRQHTGIQPPETSLERRPRAEKPTTFSRIMLQCLSNAFTRASLRTSMSVDGPHDMTC